VGSLPAPAQPGRQIRAKRSQTPPRHSSPGQQGCATPPHPRQVPRSQNSVSVPQVPPGQHGPPSMPQVWQVRPLKGLDVHTAPSAQEPSPQHG